MKAIIDSGFLLKELKKISPIIKTNTILPILSCVKLDFKKDLLVATITDLETTGSVQVKCECKTPFVTIMEAGRLIDVCDKFPTQPFTLDAGGKTITLTGDFSKLSFAKGGSEKEFPNVEDDAMEYAFDADADFFKALVNANNCRHAEMIRQNMCTPCINALNGKIVIAGTDALVLYEKTLPVESKIKSQLLVADKFVQSVKSFKSGKVFIGEKFVKIENENLVIISRLMEGKYVDYKVVIPNEIKYNLTVNRTEFLSKLNQASVASPKTTHFCKLSFEGNTMTISSSDVDFGNKSEVRMQVESRVETEAIGLNSSQMVKFLSMMDTDMVELAISTPTKSIFMSPVEDRSTLMLIQPLAI